MRKARSFEAVAAGSVALGLTVLAVMFALYLRYVRYERVALRHLPPGTVLAVRLDVEQAIFYEPIRRHVLPLFGGPSSPPAQADARLSRIELRSRFKRSDLREIVVGRGDSRADWVIVLAGLFPRDLGSETLAAALSDEPGWTRTDEGRVAEHGSGLTVGRAQDGAIVIASSRSLFASALRPSDTAERLGLSSSGAGGFALSSRAIAELSTWPPVLVAGRLPGDLGRLDSITAVFVPGERITVVTTFHASDTGAAEQSAKGALELMRARGRASESRAAELLRAGLDRAAIRHADRGAELSVEWEREEVDYALASLADAIRSRW